MKRNGTRWSLYLLSACLALPGVLAAGTVNGHISVSEDRVEVGTIPVLEWDTEFSKAVLDDLVDTEEGDVEAKTKVTYELRVLGAGWSNGDVFHDVVGWYGLGGGDWVQFFEGKDGDIDASKVVLTGTLEEGQTMDFMGRGFHGYQLITYDFGHGPVTFNAAVWSSYRQATVDLQNVIALANGDSAPQLDPAYPIQTGINDYLAPYVNSATGKMVLGPRDLVYIFDFNTYGKSGYDLQDLVLLLTFEESEED